MGYRLDEPPSPLGDLEKALEQLETTETGLLGDDQVAQIQALRGKIKGIIFDSTPNRS